MEESQNTVNSEKSEPISRVERVALERSGQTLIYRPTEKIGVVVVENFPALGKLTALRFLEWVQANPGSVISLPTGKTPEYFIKCVNHYLNTWEETETASITKGTRMFTFMQTAQSTSGILNYR